MSIEEIQDLFDRARQVCAGSKNPLEGAEIGIFRAVYADRIEASGRLGKFLLDVGTCPDEVLEYVKKLIEGKREETLSTLTRAA